MTEALGPKIRKQRRRLGLTLDELAGRTGISKPYLSLIETSRVPNPPSDEKLRRIEQTLGFPSNELLTQAHLQRTPRDVRAMLGQLLSRRQGNTARSAEDCGAAAISTAVNSNEPTAEMRIAANSPEGNSITESISGPAELDAAFVSGVLHELVGATRDEAQNGSRNAVPVINGVAAAYPRDFTDLSYPSRVADEFVGCPDLADKEAFAARVQGDSMTPKYRAGDIVIFSPAATTRSGDDCFVRFGDGQTTFKRIFFENDTTSRLPMIRLQPRNERYRAMVVPSNQITGLYRAAFRYQRVNED